MAPARRVGRWAAVPGSWLGTADSDAWIHCSTGDRLSGMGQVQRRTTRPFMSGWSAAE